MFLNKHKTVQLMTEWDGCPLVFPLATCVDVLLINIKLISTFPHSGIEMPEAIAGQELGDSASPIPVAFH